MHLTYYNLSADPFRLSPDPRFCFPHRTYRKAMTYMRHALLRAEGFFIITGQPGMGKTTLINDLLRSLRPGELSVARLVSTQLQADDLLRLVAYELNLAPTGMDKATMLNQVTNFLGQQHREGRRTLLVVDEAQDVSGEALEELRLLTNIQIDGHQLLQIFLVGQEELRDVVSDPSLVQLHQRVIAATHLDPLDVTETRDYVKHRLRRVGWEGSPLISNQAYAMIHRFSRGIPRQVNQICSRLLLHGSLEERDRLGLEDIKIVIEELHGEMLLPPGMQEIAESMVWPEHFRQETYDERPLARPETRASATDHDSADRITAGGDPEAAEPRDIPAASADKTIGSVSGGSLPDGRTAANDSSTPSNIPRATITDRPVPVATDTSPGRGGHRLGPLRLLSVFTLLAGLLLVLLYALDSETRQRLRDGLAALNLPAPPWQASQPLVAGDPPVAGIPAPRNTASTAPQITAEENISATADRRTTDRVTTTRTEATAQTAVASTPAADSARATATDAGQPADSTSLADIEQELGASGLLVERMGHDSLKVSLSGDGVFEFNSTSINDSTGSMLDRLAGVLTARDNVRVSVIGHTDSSGEPDYNVYLSQLRAKAVVDRLIGQGLPEDRTQFEGRGDRDTQFEESTREQPELRRRVEIYISPFREE